MDPSERRELYRRLRDLEDGAVHVRKGTVTATSPLAVSIGGADVPYAGVRSLAGQTFTVDDRVACLTWKGDLIVLGVIQ